jgi:hypothetical protein
MVRPGSASTASSSRVAFADAYTTCITPRSASSKRTSWSGEGCEVSHSLESNRGARFRGPDDPAVLGGRRRPHASSSHGPAALAKREAGRSRRTVPPHGRTLLTGDAAWKRSIRGRTFSKSVDAARSGCWRDRDASPQRWFATMPEACLRLIVTLGSWSLYSSAAKLAGAFDR